MADYIVNTKKAIAIKSDYQNMRSQMKAIEDAIQTIAACSCMWKQSFNPVQVQMKELVRQIEGERGKMSSLENVLTDIIRLYEQAEQAIIEHAKDPSSSDRGKKKREDESNGTDSSEVDPSSMSYEDYLQYRIDHAVDENTKKMYERFLDNIRIKDDAYDGTAYYDGFWNHIKYNKEKDATNERGTGCTYFHEVGHLVDDQSDWFGDTSTDSDYDFYDKLSQDVDNYVKKIMDEKGYTDVQDAYDDLSDWLNVDGNMKNGVSDLVNGLTDGKACGGWAHSDDYYKESSVSHEAFAHFFEAGMAADPKKLDYIKEMFPSAYEEYQRMLEDELN
ncbi:MAG: hypothetical protein E7256_11155 [Lachnospiraceae bacterium]|nr:hypothetical protein [Lachnospiraceae bacterium]